MMSKEHVKETHLRFARHLEELKDYDEAANHYISGGEPELAVEMYVRVDLASMPEFNHGLIPFFAQVHGHRIARRRH